MRPYPEAKSERQQMTYDLAIGDRTYSSWSLRGWLLFEKFGLPVRVHTGRLYSPDFNRLLGEFAPARLVPAMRTPEGWIIGETLAIAETLAERHPDAGLWPKDAEARSMARWLAAEMHAGFGNLRNDCPMNLATSYADFAPSPEVLNDLKRIDELWGMVRMRFGSHGPWLFGTYSMADAFFAPVAARIAGYNLPVSKAAEEYVASHLADLAFRRWRAMGKAENHEQAHYRQPFTERAWPGPNPLPAKLSDGPSVNATCPYSGKPVTDYLEFDGRVWGFCNRFCRDKTMADPEAWPKFMAITGERADVNHS
jgi:glutathione S-transferase